MTQANAQTPPPPSPNSERISKQGIAGHTARAFQNSAITPLLALLGLLLGFFAIMVTPKEEEPQIDVTFANVFIGFPGASAREVEQLVAIPAEQVMSEIKGVDDIKIPHHGSKNGLTQELLDASSPEVAVISVGKNSYGHPHKEVLDMLARYGLPDGQEGFRVFRTDLDGSVEIITDGDRFWVED